jgi:hypothetical protein
MQVSFPWFAFNFTDYPNACKAFMTFMMEAPQYNAWLQESVGYFTQAMHAYDDHPVWEEDPKRRVFKEASARSRSIAYAGSLGYAAAGVLADFVMVDMVAQAATGQLSPEEAAAEAAAETLNWPRGGLRRISGHRAAGCFDCRGFQRGVGGDYYRTQPTRRIGQLLAHPAGQLDCRCRACCFWHGGSLGHSPAGFFGQKPAQRPD